ATRSAGAIVSDWMPWELITYPQAEHPRQRQHLLPSYSPDRESACSFAAHLSIRSLIFASLFQALPPPQSFFPISRSRLCIDPASLFSLFPTASNFVLSDYPHPPQFPVYFCERNIQRTLPALM